jgi:hypothetical protein
MKTIAMMVEEASAEASEVGGELAFQVNASRLCPLQNQGTHNFHVNFK